MADIKHGLSVLLKNIKIAPEKPGVYRMLGEGDKVLYVGKAKNIKKRIVAYSHIEKLKEQIHTVEDKRTQLIDLCISGAITKQEFITKREACDKEISKIRSAA